MKTLSLWGATLLAAVTAADHFKIDARDDSGSTWGANATSPPYYPSPWMNPEAFGWEEAYAKAKALVEQMTLPEKVNITTGVGWMSGPCVGNTGSVPRLGIEPACMQDGPNGIRFDDSSSTFGAGLMTAATWDRDLIEAHGRAIGSEARDKNITVLLAPVCGPLGRHPDGGRNVEGSSPDPYLAGVVVSQIIKGMQGAGIVACIKHYINNEQEHFRQVPESIGRGFNISEALSSNSDDQTLHELYGWPFQDAVHAGVGSVMCSYNQINNSYGCQNSWLINYVLKDLWGFQGFVMSDWQAQHTGVASAAAGLDMSMPGDTVFNSGVSYWGANLTLAVVNGTVPPWRLDDMVMRILGSLFNVGQDPQNLGRPNFNSWTQDTFGYIQAFAHENFEQVNWDVDVREDHANNIRKIAASGSVVLKNNDVLPLDKPVFIAVIGEDAGQNPAGPNACDDRGCDIGTLASQWGSGTSEFPYLVTPDTALQNQALQDGTRYESITNNYQTEAIKVLVAKPDVIPIVFVNADSGEGFIDVDDNPGDRKNLTFWRGGDDLIRTVAALNNNTILVMHTVGSILLEEYANHPNISALIWAGIPGQESGNSITDLLYGKQDPGRLPFTMGPSLESYGTEIVREPNNGNGAPQADFTEGRHIDYRHFDRVAPNRDDPGAPVYEFGFGLSYTTFNYSNLLIRKHDIGPMVAPSGMTIAAPVLGNFSTDLRDYAFPENVRKILGYIYPYLDNTDSGKAASGDATYGQTAEQFLPEGASDGSPQPRPPASGEPGGNPQLWDVLYTVTVTITNTGNRTSDEIPQLYVAHGAPDDPPKALRGFKRLYKIAPGEHRNVDFELTRRDMSNWNTTSQNWVITPHSKRVMVGQSSRILPLVEDLP